MLIADACALSLKARRATQTFLSCAMQTPHSRLHLNFHELELTAPAIAATPTAANGVLTNHYFPRFIEQQSKDDRCAGSMLSLATGGYFERHQLLRAEIRPADSEPAGAR
jgi:hypothetical protein